MHTDMLGHIHQSATRQTHFTVGRIFLKHPDMLHGHRLLSISLKSRGGYNMRHHPVEIFMFYRPVLL